MRHLDAGALFIQGLVEQKRTTVCKVPGTENCSDIFTKYLDAKTFEKHLAAVGVCDTTHMDLGQVCFLYPSDAADDLHVVTPGSRRIC